LTKLNLHMTLLFWDGNQ